MTVILRESSDVDCAYVSIYLDIKIRLGPIKYLKTR
jgi:hypothetical protein